MVRAVEHRDLEVHHRVARQVPAHPRILDALFDCGHELARDRPAEDVVGELEVAAARHRLHADLAVAELPVAAGLLLVAAVRLDRHGDGLAIRDARRLEVHLDAEAALEFGDGHLDVQLALARQQQFLGLRVARVADRRVLFLQPVHRGADLVLVAARLGLDRVRQHGLREADGRDRQPAFLRQRVVGQRVLQLGDGADVARLAARARWSASCPASR